MCVAFTFFDSLIVNRSKKSRTPNCEVYYDDAKSVPSRYSQMLGSHFTAPPAGPPLPPPLRSTSDENKYGAYEEPVINNGNIKDVGLLNTDETYQDAGNCMD